MTPLNFQQGFAQPLPDKKAKRSSVQCCNCTQFFFVFLSFIGFRISDPVPVLLDNFTNVAHCHGHFRWIVLLSFFEKRKIFFTIIKTTFCIIQNFSKLIQTDRKIILGGREVSLAQQYGVVAVCSVPMFLFAGAGMIINLCIDQHRLQGLSWEFETAVAKNQWIPDITV